MTYPYRSQWDDDGSQRINDCGPACVAMVLDGRGIHAPINAISAETMPDGDVGTDKRDLVNALTKRGVKASVWTGNGYPPTPFIALVDYSGFERSNVQDVNFKSWHWMVVLSLDDATVVVHDPDYWAARRSEGDHKRYNRKEFDAAFRPYDALRGAIVWDDPQPMTLTVYADEYARVRMGPSTNDVIMGGVKTGERVTVTDYAGDWAIVQLSAGGAPIMHESDTAKPVIAYMHGGLLKRD